MLPSEQKFAYRYLLATTLLWLQDGRQCKSTATALFPWWYDELEMSQKLR